MKRFVTGLIAGIVIGLTLFNGNPLEGSAPNIRLIVNGHLVSPDVPPLMVNNRVMVPARFVAEPLGATVDWNESMQAVVITTRPAAAKAQIPSIKSNTNPTTTTKTTNGASTTTTKTTPTSKTTTTSKTVGSGVKAPAEPTLPSTTLNDETGKTKPGLQGLTPDFD